MSTTGICIMCGVNTHTCCSRCKTTLYCSQKCQKDGWKLHKPNCVKTLTPTEIESLNFSLQSIGPNFIGEDFKSYDENYSLANAALKSNDPATALALYIKCKPYDKVSPEEESQFHLNISLAYTLLYNFTRGLREVKRAVVINPNNAPAYNLMSVYYQAAGHYNKSVVLIKRSIEIEPNVREYYNRYMSLLIIIDKDFLEFKRIEALVQEKFK